MEGKGRDGQRRHSDRADGGGLSLAAHLGILALALLATAVSGRAGELVDLQVFENGGAYHVRLDMVIHADPAHVRAALTDYSHVYRFNPAIVESEILPSVDETAVRVRTRFEECVAFYCVDLVSVVDIWARPSGDLRVEVVPRLSSFRSGTAEWRIRPEHGFSRVVYEATMVPDFFVPPVVGRHIVIKKLAEETMTTLFRLECMAQVRARRDAGEEAREASLHAGPGCGDDGGG